MVLNATELADRLRQIRGSAGYLVKLVVFEGENHGSVMTPAIARAMGFALSPKSRE